MSIRLANTDDINELVDQLRLADVAYIDTEFHAERQYIPTLFLVQVQPANGDTWLLDPLIDGLLNQAADALVSVPWVLHGGSQDMKLLHREFGRLPETILDTQIGAGLLSVDFPCGFGRLVNRFLGQELQKSATLSDWSRRPLSSDQLKYAADDVHYLPALWKAIDTQLQAKGRAEYARKACADAQAEALAPFDADTAWRRIPGSGSLDPRQASVLRELIAWRDERAQQRNQPQRAVLSDGVIRDLAKRQPTSAQQLMDNRRLPRNVRHKLADQLIEIVCRGRSIPKAERPRVIRTHSDRAILATWLQCFAQSLGQREQISSRLILPLHLRERIALSPPKRRDDVTELLGPWRNDILGDALWDALDGDLGLGLKGGLVRPVSLSTAT
jgi:ribonuclease D